MRRASPPTNAPRDTLPAGGPRREAPMQLPTEFQVRLDQLVTQVSRALGRDISREAVLCIVIGYGLTAAEERRDLARRVRDGRLPHRVQRRTRARGVPVS
jgi:hypothetical protein